MRKIIPFLFVVLLCCPTLLATDLSPIVDSQTISVGRLDLKQVDLEKILRFLADEVKEIVPQLQPNPADAGQTILMAQGGLMAAGMYVQSILTPLQNEGKADEIFFIFDKKALDGGIYPLFVAVPASDSKPKEEVEAIRRLFLQNHLQVVFQRHGFLIGMPVLENLGFTDKDEVMSFVRQRYANPSTEKRPEFAEALGRPDVAGSMIQVVHGGFSMFEEEINAAPEFPPGFSPEFQEIYNQALANLVLEKLNYTTMSLTIQKPEIKAILSMKGEEEAKEMFEINEKISRLFLQLIRQPQSEGSFNMISPASLFMGINAACEQKLVGKEVHLSFDEKMYTAIKQAVIEMVKLQGTMNQAQKNETAIFIRAMRTPLEVYRLDHGQYPTTAQGLDALLVPAVGVDPSKGEWPYMDFSAVKPDPWGNPYQYMSPGQRNPDGYDLWSLGPDMTDGTEDDIGNW